MNIEKIIFGFFIVLALTLNFGFFIGVFENPGHHNIYELFAAIVVNIIATILKFGDRTQIGTLLLATSLVAVLELLVASVVWTNAVHFSNTGLSPDAMASIVSLSGGALLANIISVILLIIETVKVEG
jgi:hypothetical protein